MNLSAVPPSRNRDGALGLLEARFAARFSRGAEIRRQHANTVNWLGNQPPDAVVFVESTEEVAEVVSLCAAARIPVIPFGTGTALEGHVNAPLGGVSIDLSRMNRILAVRPEDLDCTVEAGVTRLQLNTHLRDQGLFFPIDPGADASLGGMAATRASGTNAVRYGTMRDSVVNLTVVMADGTIIKTAGRARKSSAGYDLTRLFVGSEGTLGIITELTLRLCGIPETIAAGVCAFPDVESACDATILTIQSGIPVARIELLDTLMISGTNAYAGLGLPESPHLFVEFHGSPAAVAEQTAAFGAIAADFGGTGFRSATGPEERTRLWQARHEAYFIAKSMRPGAEVVATDACVPISRLADCVRETIADIEAGGFIAPIVGHVGDGNFHVQIMLDRDNPAEVAAAEGFLKRLAERAIRMEGTCTGEHGVGQGKRRYMEIEHGRALAPMRAVKAALDPFGIMNPGKVLPE